MKLLFAINRWRVSVWLKPNVWYYVAISGNASSLNVTISDGK